MSYREEVWEEEEAEQKEEDEKEEEDEEECEDLPHRFASQNPVDVSSRLNVFRDILADSTLNEVTPSVSTKNEVTPSDYNPRCGFVA